MYENPDPAKQPTHCIEDHSCQLFLIEARVTADVLLRILDQFAVRQATVKSVEFLSVGDTAHIRVEAAGLDDWRANHLANLVRGMPCVISLSWGWRGLGEPGSKATCARPHPQLTASV